MKIYRLHFGIKGNPDMPFGSEADDGTNTEWFSDRRSAQKRLTEIRRSGELSDQRVPGIDVYNVPLTKAGVLHFLRNNQQFATDNG